LLLPTTRHWDRVDSSEETGPQGEGEGEGETERANAQIAQTTRRRLNGASVADDLDRTEVRWRPQRLSSFLLQFSPPITHVAYWDYALHVNLYDIVYVHCHQQGTDAGGGMVLVGQDGVQRPAIHFPAGGHLLAFLTCLETGLHPCGRLDPPLWSQTGKGKVFPKIKRKGTSNASSHPDSSETNGNDDDTESSDYVFRIILKIPADNSAQDVFVEENQPAMGAAPLQRADSSPRSPRWWTSSRYSRPLQSADSTGSSSSSSKSLSVSFSMSEREQQPNITDTSNTNNVTSSPSSSPGAAMFRGESLHVLCETMKRQIISRAFYGWLAHCRHLSTVRTHLSGLVNETIVASKQPCDASRGIDNESWNRLFVNGVLSDSSEFYRLVFYGGVAPNLRKEVWPYLLGHYPFGSTADEREAQDKAVQAAYEATMSEWLAVEAIIRQRDKEITAARIAKISSGSQSGSQHPHDMTLNGQGRSLSNEVFDDVSSEDDYDSEGEHAADKEHMSAQSQETVTVQVLTTHPSSGSENTDQDQDQDQDQKPLAQDPTGVVNCTGESTSVPQFTEDLAGGECKQQLEVVDSDLNKDVHNLGVDDGHDICSMGSRSSCISPASSQGGVYSMELLETYGLNLHRIDKDVQRCDRNYHFFTPANLDKLRNVMCT